MPHKQLVYIAGPYKGKDRAEESGNVLRAAALSRLAIREGLSPIVVHPGIYLGAYGDDADDEQRAQGLDVAAEIVRAVAESGGAIWVIQRDDKTLSEGTEVEVSAYRRASRKISNRHPLPSHVIERTWSQWVEHGAQLTWGLPSKEIANETDI